MDIENLNYKNSLNSKEYLMKQVILETTRQILGMGKQKSN